ncbi:MAG: hypothetical protein R3324_20625 [Halobacteriales archaeon]|nr:hypothetical protein [Halobacteriales archaeon]
MEDGSSERKEQADDEPLMDLAEEVYRRRTDRRDEPSFPLEPGHDAGESVTSGDDSADPVDALWEAVDLEDAVFGSGGSLDDVDSGTAVVPKANFCEQCEHFSRPPTARCTHEGTQIVEFVDRERVRVHGCPVVAKRRAVGRLGREE